MRKPKRETDTVRVSRNDAVMLEKAKELFKLMDRQFTIYDGGEVIGGTRTAPQSLIPELTKINKLVRNGCLIGIAWSQGEDVLQAILAQE